MRSNLLPPELASVVGMWAIIFKATIKVVSRKWDLTKLNTITLCSLTEIQLHPSLLNKSISLVAASY